MAYGTVNADIIQSSVSGVSLGAGNASIMKNRIINGAMVIDQRNAGASVTITNTASNTYTLDRWFAYGTVASKFSVQQNAGAVTPPMGFSNYFGVTSLSSYSIGSGDVLFFGQKIEGFNTADLGWGTANAKTVTLSFQVYSSLTGTFGGSLQNATNVYSYPFTFSIPVANTWTTINITIAGPTAGTWAGATNGSGIQVNFGLGVGSTLSGTAGSWSANSYYSATGATSVVGTSGATFYITGVQLEVGSSATGFEYRQYQQELALCQRYFEKSFPIETKPADNTVSNDRMAGMAFTTNNVNVWARFAVTKRAAPTMTPYSSTATGGTTNWGRYMPSAGPWTQGTGQTFSSYTDSFYTDFSATSTGGTSYICCGNWTASAEL